jgi:hypothetical protein
VYELHDQVLVLLVLAIGQHPAVYMQPQRLQGDRRTRPSRGPAPGSPVKRGRQRGSERGVTT